MIDFSAATYGKAAAAPTREETMPILTDTFPGVTPLLITTPAAPSAFAHLLERETSTVGRVTVPQASTDLLDAPAQWTWQQLRDYVLRSIADRHGPQPPTDPAREASIFKSFHGRWGAQAGPIARFAFEQQDGYWNSAPVTATRFCKASDQYFAAPIAERLTA
ncbi:hypothetical protein [Streptomyces sp. cg35]|uniref:hypothetical protein n=1 Tax=Streptomyces sp. cg35 TaxID=3421650 RepID=UPI003D16F282